MHRLLSILLAPAALVAGAAAQPQVERLPTPEALAKASEGGPALVASPSPGIGADDLHAGLQELAADLPEEWAVFLAEPPPQRPGAPLRWPTDACFVWEGGEILDWDAQFATLDELAEWLGRVREGRIDAEYAGERYAASDQSAMATSCLARRLARAGLHDQAAERYLECFDDLTQLGPPLLLRLTPEMRELSESSDAARERFAAEASARLDAATLEVQDADNDISIFLFSASGSVAPYAEWLAQREADLAAQLTPGVEPTAEQLSYARQFAQRRRKSVQLLLLCAEYATLAEICWAPEREVGAVFAGFPAPQEPAPPIPQFDRRRFEAASHVGAMYASLLTVGRDEQAARLAELTVESWDNPYALIAMLQMALTAGQPREAHLVWAERIDAELPEDRRPGGGRPLTEVIREALDSSRAPQG